MPMFIHVFWLIKKCLSLHSDINGGVSRSELEFILRLEEIKANCSHQISVLEVSAATGDGLRNVAKWIQENIKT